VVIGGGLIVIAVVAMVVTMISERDRKPGQRVLPG